MQIVQPENYDHLSPSDAVILQKQLRQQINLTPLKKPIKLIGGADISFNKFEDTVYAGIVILKYPEMIPIETVSIVAETKFPYISGLLAFRELPHY
ncbi:endonuclease V [Niabella ginsengisoli]|uniref:Endonuclease V n=1 Tax=Niabella ginsengisoli TaxID=522298 RepID=A0ABS9SGD2_9BACT|nr:endonuclease V [Niabella ginsengisoli]MCH5597214.1 endonuclease V [Niabella ginsengisoli]